MGREDRSLIEMIESPEEENRHLRELLRSTLNKLVDAERDAAELRDMLEHRDDLEQR